MPLMIHTVADAPPVHGVSKQFIAVVLQFLLPSRRWPADHRTYNFEILSLKNLLNFGFSVRTIGSAIGLWKGLPLKRGKNLGSRRKRNRGCTLFVRELGPITFLHARADFFSFAPVSMGRALDVESASPTLSWSLSISPMRAVLQTE